MEGAVKVKKHRLVRIQVMVTKEFMEFLSKQSKQRGISKSSISWEVLKNWKSYKEQSQ